MSKEITKYEYKILSENQWEHELNNLGREGWELVAYTNNMNSTSAFITRYEYIFKRTLPSL